LNGVYFGVRAAVLVVPPFADDLVVAYDHTPYQGVGAYVTATQGGELQRAPHKKLIVRMIVLLH
jgi:hypothetical protein